MDSRMDMRSEPRMDPRDARAPYPPPYGHYQPPPVLPVRGDEAENRKLVLQRIELALHEKKMEIMKMDPRRPHPVSG